MLLNNTGNHNTISGNIQNTVINFISETTATSAQSYSTNAGGAWIIRVG